MAGIITIIREKVSPIIIKCNKIDSLVMLKKASYLLDIYIYIYTRVTKISNIYQDYHGWKHTSHNICTNNQISVPEDDVTDASRRDVQIPGEDFSQLINNSNPSI